jgi:hypothetical protein
VHESTKPRLAATIPLPSIVAQRLAAMQRLVDEFRERPCTPMAACAFEKK